MSLNIWITIIAFVIINSILIILRMKEPVDQEEKAKQKNIRKLRAMQALNLRENALIQKYNDRLDEKTKYDKKYKVESLLMQAGLPKVSFGEIKITQMGFSVLSFLAGFFLLGNILIAVVLAGVGYFSPTIIVSIIANKRMGQMEKQVGSFIQLITERYRSHGDLAKAIEQTAPDFKGMEPMNSELQRTILEMQVGTPTETAIKNLGRRTGNKFLIMFSNYYSISATLGTEDARDRIVSQAWLQFNEDYKMKQTLREQIAGPRNEAYFMLAFIPAVIAFQIFTNDDYLPFMLHSLMGQMGTAGIILVIVGSVWFINKKIGGPLD